MRTIYQNLSVNIVIVSMVEVNQILWLTLDITSCVHFV